MALPERFDSPSTLRPPQFRLATLFLAVGSLSVLFAAMSALGAVWSTFLGFFLLLIAGHVTGNAIGTKLHGDSTLLRRSTPSATRSMAALQARNMAAVQASRAVEGLHVGRIALAVALVVGLTGAILGGLSFASIYGAHIAAGGLVLVTCSFGVLGGLAGFMVTSFVSVSRQAMSEALGPQMPARSSDARRTRD